MDTGLLFSAWGLSLFDGKFTQLIVLQIARLASSISRFSHASEALSTICRARSSILELWPAGTTAQILCAKVRIDLSSRSTGRPNF